MYSTKYVKAKDIDDAATIMESAEDGKFLAGGMTLIPTLKQRLANPDCLVDLSACGLSAIDDDGSAMRIGAMTRHVDVAESALVQKRAELNGVQAIMASNAPAVINLQRDIAALEQQIQQERERISDSDKTGQQQSMSELIAEFGNLRIQLELQTQTFAASLAALEKTRVETYQQLQHLVTIETSTLPDENKYPRVTYNLTLAAILLLLTFGIVRIIIATVREFSY